MTRRGGNLGVWVGLCCTVPLAALAAVLVFNAPTLPVSVVAFAVLIVIAPRLLAAAAESGSKKAGRGRE